MMRVQHKTFILSVLIFFCSLFPRVLNAGILKDALSFTEERPGQSQRDIPNGKQLIRVDINSLLKVDLSTHIISSAFIQQEPVRNIEKEKRVEQIKGIIEGLNSWAESLSKGWEVAQQLSITDKHDPRYDQISNEVDKKYNDFFLGYEQYTKSLLNMPGGAERASDLDAEINKDYGEGPIAGLPKILERFRIEIEWLNSQINDLAKQALENGIPLGLKMTAQFVHGNQKIPMHLPGYDDNASEIPEPYSKIRFEPNEHDKQALSEINAKATDLAATLRDAKSLQAGLTTIGQRIFNENFSRFDSAIKKLSGSVNTIRSIDWELKKKATISELESEASIIGKETVGYYQETVSSVTCILSNMAVTLNRISLALSEAKKNLEDMENNERNGKADEALIALLNITSKDKAIIDDIEKEVVSLKFPLNELNGIENQFKLKVTTLSQNERTKVIQIFQKIYLDEVFRLQQSITDFDQAIVALKQVKNNMPNQLIGQIVGASGIELPEVAKAYLMPIDSANGTVINILEAKDRDEWDKIVYRAFLYKMKKDAQNTGYIPDGKPLDEYTVYFEFSRYGSYTSPGGGVVFVSRKENTIDQSINGQASPAVSWMLHYRSWPKSKNDDGYSLNLLNILQPAIGIHTTTLHLGSNSGVEVGMGLTISIFNDIIQLGCGRDQTINERPDYYYVGFGFKFQTGIGIK